MKSLALASRPQVLKNWPVLGSRTALFFELLKFCGALEKFFGKLFFCGDHLKNFCEDLFFFGEHLRLCAWSLASSIPVLGLESVCSRKGCPWPRPRIFFVSLASSLVSSTPPLRNNFYCPVIHVDQLWALVGESVRQSYEKTPHLAPVVNCVQKGNFKLLGKGILLKQPIIVKARFFSKRTEQKIKARKPQSTKYLRQ